MLNDYLNRYTDHIDSAKLRQIRDDQQERLYAPGLKKLHDSFDAIPELKSEKNIFDQKHVTFGEASDLSDEERAKLRATLLEMLPWRKGPYDVAGIEIDCEWRSDLKWDRVKKVLDPLKGKKICDIGANSGYHMYRMLAEDPELVIGLDPTIRYWFQFQALQKLTADNQAYLEPFGLEYLEHYPSFFDVVFCMGILYHHRDPVGILRDIQKSMTVGGQLIVETQGIPGEDPYALFPVKRYAKAPGTYFVPTASCVVNWMRRAYFEDIEVFFTHEMNNDEQRATEWMPWESYADFVNEDQTKTVEGYPAPIRIYVSGRRGAQKH